MLDFVFFAFYPMQFILLSWKKGLGVSIWQSELFMSLAIFSLLDKIACYLWYDKIPTGFYRPFGHSMFVVPLDNNFSQFLLGETVAVSSPLSSLSVNKCSCTEYGINLQEPTL